MQQQRLLQKNLERNVVTILECISHILSRTRALPVPTHDPALKPRVVPGQLAEFAMPAGTTRATPGRTHAGP
jgi:hypothetical protein